MNSIICEPVNLIANQYDNNVRWWRKAGASGPPSEHRPSQERVHVWVAINLTGQNQTLGESQPNPGLPSLKLAASGNKYRITLDRSVQTGKLDEPIMSPLLTLRNTLEFPAWLTFQESQKCPLTKDPLTSTDQARSTPPGGRGKQTCTLISRGVEWLCGELRRSLTVAPPSVPVTLLRQVQWHDQLELLADHLFLEGVSPGPGKKWGMDSERGWEG